MDQIVKRHYRKTDETWGVMIFENKNKMRIWLYNDDEPILKIKYYTHLTDQVKNMQLMHS